MDFNNREPMPGDRLQQLPHQFHWAVADSSLLQSMTQGKPVQRGVSGKRLEALVQVFSRLRLVYLLLFIVGAVELAKLLLQQRGKADSNEMALLDVSQDQYPSYFFVGFGAGAEEVLFANYCADKGMPVARIDQIKVESMGQWHLVGFVKAISALFRAIALSRQAMAKLPDEYRGWESDFLTFIGMRIGQFSFASAWFTQLKSKAPNITEVCFLSPDTQAFAAVNAGIPTRFLQHGLIRHSLILPVFDYVDALTHDEIIHIRQRLPKADIRLARPIISPVDRRNSRCILVASIYGREEEMLRILPFLEFAAQQGMSIHVRPHPCEDRAFWQSREFSFGVKMEESDTTFDAALDRLHPALVVSWFSTTLVDALYRDVIPVSVSALDDENVQDMVYPLFRRCLHWPSQRYDLEKVISDEAGYEATLARLKMGMGSVPSMRGSKILHGLMDGDDLK